MPLVEDEQDEISIEFARQASSEQPPDRLSIGSFQAGNRFDGMSGSGKNNDTDSTTHNRVAEKALHVIPDDLAGYEERQELR